MPSKVPIYGADAKASGEAALPAAFDEPVRADLIKRAAISDQTWYYQPKGTKPRAGMATSARYRGRKDDFGSIKNHGIAMRAHEVLAKGKWGKARIIPGSFKGRRAHPPKIEEVLIEKMNKREYAKALHSAMAASASMQAVTARGHKVPQKLLLPIVFDSSVEEKVSKTALMNELLLRLGFEAELARADKSKRRSGVGSRKGGAIRAKTLLLVVGAKDAPLARAARNIAGVDVVSAKHLRVLDLAPGAKAGRLTAYTQSALTAIAGEGKKKE
ncbi:50S ribosomal protein L4 [uncultured archaeon]|nr:50S ribosomal protein L4 [uncultured archaeon]